MQALKRVMTRSNRLYSNYSPDIGTTHAHREWHFEFLSHLLRFATNFFGKKFFCFICAFLANFSVFPPIFRSFSNILPPFSSIYSSFHSFPRVFPHFPNFFPKKCPNIPGKISHSAEKISQFPIKLKNFAAFAISPNFNAQYHRTLASRVHLAPQHRLEAGTHFSTSHICL